MSENDAVNKKKPEKTKVTKPNEDRKPKDYDEVDVPKVLKGPVPSLQPLRSRKDYGEGEGEGSMLKEIPLMDLSEALEEKKSEPVMEPLTLPSMDYDDEPCEPCTCKEEVPPLSEEVTMPNGKITILVCPECNNEGPFNIEPPPGMPIETRTLKCAKCSTVVVFKGLMKTASGKYVVACGDVKSLADRIRGLVRQGDIITWDIAQDVNTSLDKICDLVSKKDKKSKD